MSMALGRLEAHLATRLCQRGPGGLTLTHEGEVLAELCQSLFESVRGIPSHLAHMSSDLRGRVVRRATAEHEGYAGDKSEAGSSGDEGELRRSVRGILPMLSGVAIPTPQPNRFTLDELVARGGKLMPPAPTPSAGEPQAPDEDWL